nr:uncharacterized protein LOC117225176 [Megalopta genalis]
MDPRTFLFVVIFASCDVFINFVTSNPIAIHEGTASDIIKFLVDCIHSDNETYTACFKREKRLLHSQNIDHRCMKPCLEDCSRRISQVPQACEDDCNHCIKKVKHRQIGITDAEMHILCSHENCTNNRVKREDAKHINIDVTSTVHVDNHVGTSPHQPQCPCYYHTWTPCYCRPTYTYNICRYYTYWPCY